MTKHWTRPIEWGGRVLMLLALALASGVQAAESGVMLQQAGNDLSDQASLQRGAQLFMNNCSGCHSLKYLRYSRMASDLGLSEEDVMSNLNFTGAAIGEHIHSAMPAAAGEQWFGKAPPDLSLITRVRGTDWVYTYLKSFYLDQTSPLGWNNRLFPNASMPNPLWELQGLQHAQLGKTNALGEQPVEGLEIKAPGRQTPLEFDQTVRDITNFLEYAGEPAALKRQSMGVWVVLFLVLLTFLAYLLKKEYWKDVH